MPRQEVDIRIVAAQQPGIVTFDNYPALKEQLQGVHDYYICIEYGEGELKRAKDDLAVLRKAKRVLTSAKKELKEGYTRPFSEVEAQLDELIALLKEPEDRVNAHVKAIEKAAKQADIMAYAAERAAGLGEYAAKVISSPAFFNPRWLNTTYRTNQWRQDIDDIVENAGDDISNILLTAGDAKQALLARYYETLTMEGAKEFLESLKAPVAEGGSPESAKDAGPVGYKVLKIYATEREMLRLMGMLELSGLDYEELEDGMPKAMEELAEPPTGDYVCFDIETTGTFGIDNGDGEAVITEIGAVRVAGGEVVEKFDMLANPGRKIVPRIARLTHITDEMVANELPVNEVIARFADFCRGYTLVGHNVKSCDIPHIARAAKRAGVAMENAYFDTYQYAKRFKEAQGWENVKLEYLSAQLGLEHAEAHRAWCDAEANVGVFEKLKELSQQLVRRV